MALEATLPGTRCHVQSISFDMCRSGPSFPELYEVKLLHSHHYSCLADWPDNRWPPDECSRKTLLGVPQGIFSGGKFPHQPSYLPHQPFGKANAPLVFCPFQLQSVTD